MSSVLGRKIATSTVTVYAEQPPEKLGENWILQEFRVVETGQYPQDESFDKLADALRFLICCGTAHAECRAIYENEDANGYKGVYWTSLNLKTGRFS